MEIFLKSLYIYIIIYTRIYKVICQNYNEGVKQNMHHRMKKLLHEEYKEYECNALTARVSVIMKIMEKPFENVFHRPGNVLEIDGIYQKVGKHHATYIYYPYFYVCVC